MSDHESLSKRPKLRFWGWGYDDEHLSEAETRQIDQMLSLLIPGFKPKAIPDPHIDEFDIRAPRFSVPLELSKIVSTSKYDRLVHSYGKSFPDTARMFMRQIPNPPDAVGFPESEEDLVQLFAFAEKENIAIIPYGGGTSVCGGVEPDVGSDYAGTLTIDMGCFNRLLEVDQVSRSARIQGGMLGPDIDAALKPYELTLRHFPQSYMFSTLGGWIATRAGGHFATLYTHIDDLVESVRMVTPKGVIESRRLPGSGAGPSPDRMMLGSEGILGIITEASVRLQNRPIWKATASVTFDQFMAGADAVRQITQAGLFPSNCRLLDPEEAFSTRVVKAPITVLVLGFESADHDVEPWMKRALEIAQSHGGQWNDDKVVYSNRQSQDTSAKETEADIWRNSFIRLPYWKNYVVKFGLIADTFETSITWERLAAFYKGLKSDMRKAIQEITGRPGLVACRFTHVYPDGPAVYISLIALGSERGDMSEVLENWCRIKQVANRQVIARGGTVTHHHAVGRDHRSGYEAQMPSLFRSALAATKSELDPLGIMNPGVLVEPKDRRVGIGGAMKDYTG